MPKREFYKWKFGIGINIVDDKGTRFKGLFNVRENWNAVPYPSRLSIERQVTREYSYGVTATMNRYKIGKNISGIHIVDEQSYYAIDAEFKYFFNTGLNEYSWLDPYIMLGIGNSWIDGKGRTTFNGGFGLNIWFEREADKIASRNLTFSGKKPTKSYKKKWLRAHVGLNFQTIGKVCVNFIYFDNQIQHSFGVVVRL